MLMLSRWLKRRDVAIQKTEQPLKIASTVSEETPEGRTQNLLSGTDLNVNYLPVRDAGEVNLRGKNVEVYLRYNEELLKVSEGRLSAISINHSAMFDITTDVHIHLENK